MFRFLLTGLAVFLLSPAHSALSLRLAAPRLVSPSLPLRPLMTTTLRPATAVLTPRLLAPSLLSAVSHAALDAPRAAGSPAERAGGLLAAGWEDRDISERTFRLVLRRGVSPHGQTVITIDALDARALGRGTVGHADFVINGEQAAIDQSMDFYVRPHGLPDDVVPAGADLTHFRQYFWFGLAVHPDYRGLGLGRALLTEMVAILRASGVRRLFLRATPSSVGLYRDYFGTGIVYEEEEAGRDGDVYHNLEIRL